MASPPNKTYRVGIICGSQRVVRVCPQVTDYVFDVIRQEIAETKKDVNVDANININIELERIDVATLGLPLYDEPGIPMQIQTADGYVHEHTRVWSHRIRPLDAFVFVTPQYNWGIPAGLKNAIDYLFQEWTGKPAAVVSYGGHGGDKAAAALTTVLQGLRMRVVPGGAVNLTFPSPELLAKVTQGLDIGLAVGDAKATGVWADRRDDIARLWKELLELVEE